MRHLILFVFLTSILISCNPKRTKENQLDASRDKDLLDQYFMAATVGIISTSEPLTYVFKTPLEGDFTDEDITKLIQLQPSVEGKVTLTNNTILAFTPSNPLKSNQHYTVSLNLNHIGNSNFNNIEYQIKTIDQEILVEKEGFIIEEDGSRSVLLVMKTADRTNVEAVKSCFDFYPTDMVVEERNGREFSIKCNYKKEWKEGEEIKYNGKNLGSDAVGSIKLWSVRPEIFEIVTTCHLSEMKEFHFYFSQRIQSNMDLTGLLTVQGGSGNYAIHDNVLTVYLSEWGNVDKIGITLDKNIKSASNQILSQDFNLDLELVQDRPAAIFVSDGNYFPSEGSFKIPIKTRALSALRMVVIEVKQENVMHYLAWQNLAYADFYNLRMYGKPIFDSIVPLNQGIKDQESWTVHGIDLSERIKKNPGSMYHISMSFSPEHTNLPCKNSLKNISVNTRVPGAAYFNSKEGYFDSYYYDYNWEERNDPCKLAYYLFTEVSQKMFICSDYALIAKKAGQDYHIALSKLLDLSSVSGAEVSLYDLQAEKIVAATTASDGMVQFKQIDRDAAVVKVEKNNQITYLSLDVNQSNTLTEFDISGERSEVETEFFAYTDRDVWRPGDSIFIDLMINKAECLLPNGMPVTLTFYNTENIKIDEQVQRINVDQNQIYSFKLRTAPNAKTGVYRCVFKAGPKTIKKNIRVETIQPNVAEIHYSFDNLDNDRVLSDQISGSLQVKYLTGFSISSAQVKASAKAKKLVHPFAEYKKYQFDTYEQNDNFQFELFDLKTNAEGNGTFKCSESLKQWNSPVKISLETNVLLPGGGINKLGKSLEVSPFITYIGALRKDGKGWSGNHTFDENIEVSLVNLNNKGKLHNIQNSVNYTLQQHISSWWVDKYRLRSEGNFVSSEYWKDVQNGEIKINGKGLLSFEKGSLGRGAYKLTMTDAASGHMTQTFFTVYDGVENIPGSQPYMVEFKTDKESYKIGENIKIMLPDIDEGKALISIERGNRIINQSWYNLAQKNNVVSLKTTDDWAPNVYIHVTIMQKYQQTANDLPLRMYGIRYVSIDRMDQNIIPVSTIPNVLESGKTYTFDVSEKNGKAMEYTLALVDEGLLNLTGFSTPNPAKHFNGKFPLLVKTWDIYQYLIQYFKGKFAGIISIGGDDAYNPDAIAEINRFKPVSMHQGPFKLDKGGKKSHSITIPNYIGKLRLMIVACNTYHFGSEEKLIPVKNPLMLQTQFPRTLNVSDQLQLPVTIFKDDKAITSAQLKTMADQNMVKGFGPSQSLNFGNKDQITHFYNVEVLNKTGPLKVDMTVSGSGKTMTESTDILVNYPNAFQSYQKFATIEPRTKLDWTLMPRGYKEAFHSKFIISGFKVPNFSKYVEELIAYPYGCLEQTTSVGFGQLYLDKIMQLDSKTDKERLGNLKATVQQLARFQQSSGKFNYWDGSYYHAWSDIYAGNFLVEMQKRQYLTSSSDMLNAWVNAHHNTANLWSLNNLSNEHTTESESFIQAFRIYVLAKAGKPAKPAMNKFAASNTAKNPITWWLIAGAYQLSGFSSKAKEFIMKAESLQGAYKEEDYYASFGDKSRDWALITEIVTRFKDMEKKAELYYGQMVDMLNQQSWTSTQTKAFACIAAYKYYGESLNINVNLNYTISGLFATPKTYNLNATVPNVITTDKSHFGKTITINNSGKGKLFVYQIDRYIDDQLIKPEVSNQLKIQTEYYNASQRKKGLDKLKLGDDVVINVTVMNILPVAVQDLALNVKMPAGWELKNPRLYETEDQSLPGNVVYQDFKDDRVYTFFKLSSGASQNFVFKAKASFTGNFFMPAISCEHMYNGNINARTSSQRVLVE